MSTDTRPPHHPTPREAAAEEPAKPKIDLSLTQVLAGALAAMTAAYLGSRLSVAGTVVGAAVASVVAAVAGSVYSASLRTTQQHVRTVFQGRVAGSTVPTTVESVEDRGAASPAEAPAQPSAPTVDATPATRRPRLSWKNVLVAAVAAFALAGAVLTGVELATGSALSGGDGTTIGQVAEPQRRDPQPAESPSAPPSETAPSATPSATAEPSDQPTAEPSSTPEATPEPAPEPSTTEAPTPTTPAPSVSSTPGATPTPSTGDTPADQG